MSDGSGRNLSSSELEARIRETRARLARDIDAARLKFSKQGLQHEAVSAIRGVRNETSGAIADVDSGARSRSNQIGRIVVDAVKRYPGVTTLLGLGVAMLVLGVTGNDGPARRRARTYDTRAARYEATPELPAPRSTATAELPPSTM